MFIYIFSFFVLFLFAISEKSWSNKENNNIFFIVVMFLGFVCGFRDMIGGYDVYIYAEYFDNISFDDFSSVNYATILAFEKGYVIYNYLIHIITNNRYMFFLITALISYYMFYEVIRRNTTYLFFALLILYCKFFLMSFVYVRQTLAMAIVWLSVRFIVKRKAFAFFCLLFVASSFHVSAILFAVVYFIGVIRFSKKTTIYLMLLSILLGMTPFIRLLFGVVGESANIDKAVMYASTENGFANLFYFLECIVLGFGILKYRDKLYVNKHMTVLTNIAICYICITFLVIRDATSLRLNWYFLIGLMCVIPVICSIVRHKYTSFKFFVILYFLVLFFRLLLLWDGGDMLPYKTFLENGDRNTRWEYKEYDSQYEINKLYK